MRIYVDSGALLKRVFAEAESAALLSALSGYLDEDASLVSSSLAWVEVSRAVGTAAVGDTTLRVEGLTDTALSGIRLQPISAEVVALARRLTPPTLRSLGSIHLASALLIDADLLIAYDQRLLEAAQHHGLPVGSTMGCRSARRPETRPPHASRRQPQESCTCPKVVAPHCPGDESGIG